jgi:hypothetical protein
LSAKLLEVLFWTPVRRVSHQSIAASPTSAMLSRRLRAGA